MRQLKWQINRRSLLHRQSIYPLILSTFFQLRQLHERERQLPEGGGGQWVQEADRTRAAALTLLHSLQWPNTGCTCHPLPKAGDSHH